MTSDRAKVEPSNSAAAAPKPDYYSVLQDMIDRVSQDRTQLRKVVYALAWHHFRSEALLSPLFPDAQSRAKTISRHSSERLEMEQAIERLEADAAQQPTPGLEHERSLPDRGTGAADTISQPQNLAARARTGSEGDVRQRSCHSSRAATRVDAAN